MFMDNLRSHRLAKFLLLGFLLLISACATQPVTQFDYTAFKASRPASILVLPPLNNSPEVEGGSAVMAQAIVPLSEAGYYVFPVTLVAETFKENGFTSAHDIHQINISKLQEIFSADAALYLTVQQYGSSYTVVDSKVTVEIEATLVDLKSGAVLWNGRSIANDAQNSSNQNGIIGMLVNAVVKQIVNSVSDTSFPVAGFASRRLLSGGMPNGVLYGPYSPKYQTD